MQYIHAANKQLPIFQTHGDCDPLLPKSIGIESAKLLRQHVPNHVFKIYPNLLHDANDEVRMFEVLCNCVTFLKGILTTNFAKFQVLRDMNIRLTEWIPETIPEK